MASHSTLSELAAGVGQALAKLGELLASDEAFRGLMLELGWHSATIPAPIAALAAPVDALAQALGDGQLDVDEVPAVVTAIQDLAAALADLENQGASFPVELAADGFHQQIGAQLIDLLLIDFLEEHHPLAISLATALGVARETELDDEGNRPGSIQHSIAWEAVPSLLGDPQQLFVDAYGWGTDAFEHGLLLELLLNVGESLDLSLALVELDDETRGVLDAGSTEDDEDGGTAIQLALLESDDGEVGVRFYGLPQAGGRGRGVAIMPYGIGAPPLSFAISDAFALTVTTGLDLTSGVAAILRPGEPLEVLSEIASQSGGAPVSGGEIRAELAYTGDAEAQVLLLGTSPGTRLEAAGVAIAAGMIAQGGGNDLYLEAELVGGRLAISTEEAGSFVAMLLGDADRIVELSPAFGLSTARGAYLRGGSELSWLLPLSLTLGPILIEEITIEIVAAGDTVSVDVTAAITTVLGPFSALVDRLGVRGTFAFPGSGGNLGPLDAGVELVPPTALLLAIDADAVTGGGLIELDAARGRYSGGLALDIFGIGVAAVVVADTEVPGSGWALFASLGATFAAPIPIGFGFTLIGVGGLLAVNRTLDIDALAPALKSGAADAILFPDDILADADAILDGLDAWFPLQAGTTVFGPVIEIGWGNPTLLSAQLGLAIALPDAIVAVLGSVEMLLPTPEAAVISLRMDILGAVDVPASEVTVAASLHDSNLLGIFELSGDMGFFARLAGQPLFVLSVGGYHPQFDPPGAIPSWLLDLRRTSAAVPLGAGVEVVLSAYVALTSNTVQLGGRVQITASVKVLLTTYTAEGWFSIDLLLVLTPFGFAARASAGVAITAGDRELFGVRLSARLEGPEPWYASGQATFDFFGLEVDFGFEIGDRIGGQPRLPHDVAADVAAALEASEAWRAADAADAWGRDVVLGETLPEGLWVRPDQTVEVRQSLAPLNRTITAYGEMVPTAERIDAGDVVLGAEPVAAPDWIEDWFAPAQFDRLDDSDSLGSPSYELMTCGVRFGDAGVAISDDPDADCTTVSRAPEESIFTADEPRISRFVSPARGVPKAAATKVVGPQLTLATTAYAVVAVDDGTLAGADGLTYAEAVAALEATAVDPATRGRLRVAPSHAVRAP